MDNKLKVAKKWLRERGTDFHVIADQIFVYSMVSGAVLSPQSRDEFLSGYEDWGEGNILSDEDKPIRITREGVLNKLVWLKEILKQGILTKEEYDEGVNRTNPIAKGLAQGQF